MLADVAGTDTAADASCLLIADMSGGSATTMHLARGEVQRQPLAISRTFTVGTLRKPHLDAGSASLTGDAVNPKAFLNGQQVLTAREEGGIEQAHGGGPVDGGYPQGCTGPL